jgi:hypothetical protein
MGPERSLGTDQRSGRHTVQRKTLFTFATHRTGRRPGQRRESVTYSGKSGVWRRVHTASDGLVDASEFCFTPEKRVALAATVVEVDQAE